MKKLIVALAFVTALSAGAIADDLYKVNIHNSNDAEVLRGISTDVILKIRGGYLILADEAASRAVQQSGLDTELLATDLRRDQLSIDGRFDRKNAEKFEVLYEDGNQRLLLAGLDRLAMEDPPVEAYPIPDKYVKIAYQPLITDELPEVSTAVLGEIDDLVDAINQDSLESYVAALQDFFVRLPNTAPAHAARDWIADKFADFEYDSVVVDTFIGAQIWTYTPCPCYNVMAYKIGTTMPDQKIIIGGHWDAVPYCPGADDNASGTAAVLEIARVLKDIETNMTIIFIAFDAEEAGLLGAHHYARAAAERNEDIVVMLNADMIAHLTNNDRANIYFNLITAYAGLWGSMAATYGTISNTDLIYSPGGGSDQSPFWEAGYHALFIQEDIFSPNWHDPTDSIEYMNFEYMTKMVRSTVATAYTVDRHMPPIRITDIQEPGDGHSQLVHWQAIDPSLVQYYRVTWHKTAEPWNLYEINVSNTESSHMVLGLTEGEEYAFSVEAYDHAFQTSFTQRYAYATPCSIPIAPQDVMALPERESIRIHWAVANEELDFDHCSVVRDGDIVAEVTSGNQYLDTDPALGSDLHYYYVVAVDTDDNTSDTVGIPPTWMKAAALQPDRILAVNRTSVRTIDLVDEKETGAFMRQALEGYNFDYYSDSVAITKPWLEEQLDLIDMIDYGVMVVGTEAARTDDIGVSPDVNGILDTLAYYMSIGGKVVVFGRWGDLGEGSTIDYGATPETYDDAYHDYFHIGLRTLTPTVWYYTSNIIEYCDLVGAHSSVSGYPDLEWDSVATVAHCASQNLNIIGTPAIPCATFVGLTGGVPEVLYTYDSRFDEPLSEGQPVAWRYLGPDYGYVFFDIPLSFFDRAAASEALRKAVDDLMDMQTDTEEVQNADNLPAAYSLSQNYPNPFNPHTEIVYSIPKGGHVSLSIYNVLGQKVRTLVDREQPAGTHRVTWNGTGDNGDMAATGIYLYQLRAGDHSSSKKMLLLK